MGFVLEGGFLKQERKGYLVWHRTPIQETTRGFPFRHQENVTLSYLIVDHDPGDEYDCYEFCSQDLTICVRKQDQQYVQIGIEIFG